MTLLGSWTHPGLSGAHFMKFHVTFQGKSSILPPCEGKTQNLILPILERYIRTQFSLSFLEIFITNKCESFSWVTFISGFPKSTVVSLTICETSSLYYSSVAICPFPQLFSVPKSCYVSRMLRDACTVHFKSEHKYSILRDPEPRPVCCSFCLRSARIAASTKSTKL